jgi:hypothetical protein
MNVCYKFQRSLDFLLKSLLRIFTTSSSMEGSQQPPAGGDTSNATPGIVGVSTHLQAGRSRLLSLGGSREYL